MNSTEIRNILRSPYNRENWRNLYRNIFQNKVTFHEEPYQYNVNEDIVESLFQIGYATLDDEYIVALFEVNIKSDVNLLSKKIGLRKIISKYISDDKFNGVLTIFENGSPDYRFTFASKTTKITEEGIEVVETESKRFTYILGSNEPCLTPTQRFESLFKKNGNINLEDIKDAFSVEKLNKEFFNGYKEHYELLCNYLYSIPLKKEFFNDDDKLIRDFVKKFLGRIVFLYFVQKKGWLGVKNGENWGSGDHLFLSNLYKSYKNKNQFYSKIISKIFFEYLSVDRKNDLVNLFENNSFRIPYLNGGLFEKEDVDEFEINFDEFHLESLFSFFDKFNFTIYEDDPNEHTVAVDPEMLGHIFENLLEDNKDKGAYYTPKEIVHYMCQESLIEYLITWFQNNGFEVIENIFIDKKLNLFQENESRKGQLILESNQKRKVDRVLIENLLKKNHSEDDKSIIIQLSNEFNLALDNVKICDPSIGSGAFPMGLLQEIYLTKQIIWNFVYGNLHDFPSSKIKLNIIQNSIYGVDIEKGAVDVARLRFWLSLIVDEEIPKSLPNLDYKIVIGDSLLSKFEEDIIQIDWNRKSSVGKADEYVKNIQKILNLIGEKQKEYFNPKSKNKTELQFEIRNLKIELLINQILYNKEVYESKNKSFLDIGLGLSNKEKIKNNQIANRLLEFKDLLFKLQNLRKNNNSKFEHFDWKLDFPEIFNPDIVGENIGFDIVITNPPYIGQKGNKALFQPFVNDTNFEKKMDYWHFFLHKSYELTKQSGINSFITPNYWITSQGGKKLRKRIIENYSLIEYINFNDNSIFEAGVHTNIFILKKSNIPNTKIKCTIYQNKYSENIFDNRNLELNFTSNQKEIFNTWTGFVHFLPSNVLNIINQLYINCEKLSDNNSEGEKKKDTVAGKKVTNGICNINQGIITGKDRLKDKIKDINEGVYILTPSELKSMNFTKKELEFIKPFIKNSNISKFTTSNEVEYYIIYVDDIESEAEFNILQNIKNHFLKYKEILSKRYINGVLESSYKKGKWWALIHSVPIQIIKNEKIICPQRSRYNLFAYQSRETYASADVYYISINRTSYSIKYILSILNSKVVYFWLYWMGKRKGEMLELYFEPLQFIPIKNVSNEIQLVFEKVTDYILFIKSLEKDDKKINTIIDFFENIIDCMVYEIYFPDLMKRYDISIINDLVHLQNISFIDDVEIKLKSCIISYEEITIQNNIIIQTMKKFKSISELSLIEKIKF